jgi:spore coat protein U-like protein
VLKRTEAGDHIGDFTAKFAASDETISSRCFGNRNATTNLDPGSRTAPKRGGRSRWA